MTKNTLNMSILSSARHWEHNTCHVCQGFPGPKVEERALVTTSFVLNSGFDCVDVRCNVNEAKLVILSRTIHVCQEIFSLEVTDEQYLSFHLEFLQQFPFTVCGITTNTKHVPACLQ